MSADVRVELLRVRGGVFVPDVPGELDPSRVLANSGEGKPRTLERTVFLGNVHLVLGSMLTEAAAPLKSKGIDPIGPVGVRKKRGRETENRSEAQS